MSALGPDGGLSDADRDYIVALLREHFAAGRFEVDEFGRRVEVLLRSATPEEAMAAVEGLPPLAEARPEPRRWWRRALGGRHAQTDAARAGWLPTRERFRDPSSGRLVRVWFDPADASRHYVRDEGDTTGS